MPSPESSRRNARKSTGPRTPEGKRAVRLNSLTHGAFAVDLLLPGEDSISFRRIQSQFLSHYEPCTPAEIFFVNRMILTSWRLLRLAAMESRVLRSQMNRVRSNSSFADSLTEFLMHRNDSSEPLDDSPEPPEEPSPPSDALARAWVLDAERGNTLVKLARYQVSLERSFYRALRALRSLRGEPPSPTS